MCSRPFRPLGLPIYVARGPRGSIRSSLPSRFYLDHSHCPVLAPATLAALPSTRAIPDRDVFYVAFPKSSIVSRLLPLARPLPHGFTGHVARPSRSIPFVATCSMSLIPFAPLLHRDKRAK